MLTILWWNELQIERRNERSNATTSEALSKRDWCKKSHYFILTDWLGHATMPSLIHSRGINGGNHLWLCEEPMAFLTNCFAYQKESGHCVASGLHMCLVYAGTTIWSGSGRNGAMSHLYVKNSLANIEIPSSLFWYRVSHPITPLTLSFRPRSSNSAPFHPKLAPLQPHHLSPPQPFSFLWPLQDHRASKTIVEWSHPTQRWQPSAEVPPPRVSHHNAQSMNDVILQSPYPKYALPHLDLRWQSSRLHCLLPLHEHNSQFWFAGLLPNPYPGPGE